MFKIFVLLFILFIEILTSAVPNSDELKYGFSGKSKGPVYLNTTIHLPIEKISPNQTGCNPLENVCVSTIRNGTTIGFRGNFSAVQTLRLFGDAEAWNILIVRVTPNDYFAKPMLGIFLKAKLPYSEAIHFFMPIDNVTVESAEKLVQGKLLENCYKDNLCYSVTGKKVTLWGSIGSFKFVYFNGGGKTVVIPIIRLHAFVEMNPPLLAVPESGVLDKPYYMEFNRVFKNVTVSPATVKESSACTAEDPCYEVIAAPYRASFNGILPSCPQRIAFEGHNGQRNVTYYFASEGSKMRCCLDAF